MRNLFLYNFRLFVSPNIFKPINSTNKQRRVLIHGEIQADQDYLAFCNNTFGRCQLCESLLSEMQHHNCASLDYNLLIFSCQECMQDFKGFCLTICTSAPRLRLGLYSSLLAMELTTMGAFVDYLEVYFWLHIPLNPKVMSWWDYQIRAMGITNVKLEHREKAHRILIIYKDKPPYFYQEDQQANYLITVMGQPQKTLVIEVHLLGCTLSTSHLSHKNYRVSLSLDIHPPWLWVNHMKPLPSNSIFQVARCQYHSWLISIRGYLYPQIFIHHNQGQPQTHGYWSSTNPWLWLNYTKPFSSLDHGQKKNLLTRELYAMGTIAS